jgi:hypothetical protein
MEILDFAKPCAARGAFISNFKVGHFAKGLKDQVSDPFDYDITSCYGYHLANLGNFDNAEFISYKDPNRPKTTENTIGFFECNITINEGAKIHPFAFVSEDKKPIYPAPGSSFKTFLTLNEIIAAKKYNLAAVSVLDGWFIRFRDNTKPMKELFEMM